MGKTKKFGEKLRNFVKKLRISEKNWGFSEKTEDICEKNWGFSKKKTQSTGGFGPRKSSEKMSKKKPAV